MKKVILAIETSCDDTGIALVEARGTAKAPRFKVLKNLVSSQIKIHRPFGGVVPNLAKREHLKNLPILLKKLLGSKSYILSSIDAIAVTVGPGLEPALWTGINFAQELAHEYQKPLVGNNHLEGHLYSFLLTQKSIPYSLLPTLFPAIALIVSGGHTILLLMKDLTHWKKLGETRDDAAGEAFDKVARLLGLPYPGGPEIEKTARRGNPSAITFPRPMLHDKSYDFSFSGLKTSVLYYLRDQNLKTSAEGRSASGGKSLKLKADTAASFQQAAIDVLVAKTIRAAQEFSARSIILCGGVAANKMLRATLGKETKKMGLNYFVPDFEYNNDNAAMIAAAGYMSMLRRKKLPLSARGDLNI